jgi:hypothetical protein
MPTFPRSVFLAFVFLTCLAAAPVLRLEVSNNAAVIPVPDGAPGDLNAAAGVITISTPVGNWPVVVATGYGAPTMGSALAPLMDLNVVAVTSSSNPGPLTLILFQEGNSGPAALSAQSTMGGTLSGGSSPLVTFTSCIAETSAPFTCLSSQVLGPFGPGAFAGTTSGILSNPNGNYVALQMVTIQMNGPGSASFDFEFSILETSIPEPSALALSAAGLLLLLTRRTVTRFRR